MIEEEFLGKLAKLVEEAKEKNNLIDFKKLDAFCKEQKLTGEQMDLVYQYFEDNKIEVAASTEVDSDVSAGKDGSAADGELVLEPTDEELEEEEEDKIDLDAMADEAIRQDGEAHFIAYYDGNEIDLGHGLFAYRMN